MANQAGLPKSTILVSGVAILFAGLGTFMILKWTGSKAAAAAHREQIALTDTQIAEVHTQLDPIEQELGGVKGRTEQLNPGKMAFCNETQRQVTIRVLAATWLGADERFRTFNSEAFGEDLWTIPPGGRQALSYPRGDWDGSATYYALWLRDAGQEYPLAGLWPSEPDFCVTWKDGGG